MTGDINLGGLLGVPFRHHWSWFLAVFLISWPLANGFFPQTLPEYTADRRVYWGLGLLAALGLFVSILLHELGHAFVARRFGIPVRGIRLFVFGGVAELGGEPRPESWPQDDWLPDYAYELVKADLLRGKSIGFLPLQVRSPTDAEIAKHPDLKGVRRIIEKWLLLAYACCFLPCQQNAVVETVSKGTDLPDDGARALEEIFPDSFLNRAA
ncbi:MAG: hypothetical protein JNM56_20240 [Planctomycetia bacterium]|nr:hypothetical protein [Planctomycetia bacterium]